MNLEEGMVRGNWTLLRFYEGESRARKPMWHCRCRCGYEAKVSPYSLRARPSAFCIRCRGASLIKIIVEPGAVLHGWECVSLIEDGKTVDARTWRIRCTGCGYLARRAEKMLRRPEAKTNGLGCAICARKASRDEHL